MIKQVIKAGWLILAALLFGAALDYAQWHQEFSKAKLGLAIKEAEIEYRYLKMAEFRFQMEFPKKEDERA